MKIEKISENQIRCTLTKEDLEQRNIRLSELAYGSEKARMLFRDMLMEAFEKCGFTNDANIPLMIEAIPDRENSLVLVITKVEDPEELDTRFSKFSATNVLPDDEGPSVEGADTILDTIHRFMDSKKTKKTGAAAKGGESARREGGENGPAAAPAPAKGKAQKQTARAKTQAMPVLTRMYRFRTIDHVIEAASTLRGFYKGKNTLYHLRKEGSYILVIHQSSHTAEEYNKVCNIITEYGSAEKYSGTAEAYYAEHEDTVIVGSALQELSVLTKN